MSLPVHILSKPKDAKDDPVFPKDALCFVIAANGIFKQVKNEYYECWARVENIPGLAMAKETAYLLTPKLPHKLIQQAESFFQAVYDKHQSEACVLLQCSAKKKAWRMIVPHQKVVGLSVKYDLEKCDNPPEGFQWFGTIHSHAGISAFHSSTDDADEKHFDGLHITIGDFNKPTHSFSCRWMFMGKSYKTSMTEVVEMPNGAAFDPKWMDLVEKEAFREIHSTGSHAYNAGYPNAGTRRGGYYGPDGENHWQHGHQSHQTPRTTPAPIMSGRNYRSDVSLSKVSEIPTDAENGRARYEGGTTTKTIGAAANPSQTPTFRDRLGLVNNRQRGAQDGPMADIPEHEPIFPAASGADFGLLKTIENLADSSSPLEGKTPAELEVTKIGREYRESMRDAESYAPVRDMSGL